MEKQIEEMACKNCIHYQMCVDTFRKAKQDGDILLLEEEAYFAKADGCDFYADKRVYRKQSDGEWEDMGEKYANCSNCGTIFEALPTLYAFKQNNIYCRHCGAKMKGENK